MKKILIAIGIALSFVIIPIICLLIAGLIYWGIGAFIVWLFDISFKWSFLHGLASALVIEILKTIFKKS